MKFYIYTLGCKVNTYESNVILENMLDSGYKLGTMEDSDIYIINTCTVTNTSDNKSLKMIRHFMRLNKIVLVCGCFSQHRYQLLKDMNVNIIIGNVYKSKIPELIKEYLINKKQIVKINSLDNISFEPMEIHNFNQTRAFVKIQDGCNNFCSYCIIPYTRGSVRSKDKTLVLKEINCLINKGFKEIVLTGIHTGHYGEELDYKLYNLLKDILKIDGLKRLRISSIEMNEITDDIIELIKNNDILVDHLHIPLQSGSDEILKLMNRKYNKQQFIDKINSIRLIRPNISITTDVIVGFPYETDELFKETIDTINSIKFSKIHVFPYSVRDNTKASLMPQIDNSIKKQRCHTLLDLSKQLEIQYFNKYINKEVEFIPEVYKDGYLIGHTGNYLLIKSKGDINNLNKETKVIIKKLNYPYCIGN